MSPAEPSPGGFRLPRSRGRAISLGDRAEQAAAALPALLVAADRVAATVAQGVHGRRRVGQGETFWQFRSYQPGDAASRIDWRKSAKSQRVYVRETEWEAAQSVWLWRDASASMDYGSAGQVAGGDWPTKRDRAELLLVALANLLVRGGEHVAVLGSGILPTGGRVGLARIAELIGRTADSASLPAFEPLPRAAQLVLFGDFLAPLEAIHAAVTRFAAGGLKGHILQIFDPAEEELPFEGRVRFAGIEERDEVVISRVESIRGDYAERFRQHGAALAAIARAVGWGFGTHRTDRAPHLALLGLYNALSADRRG